VTEPVHEPDWRQRKKTATRDRIRTCALRLFREQGYDATTVEQIAAAAGVSHMTFFRYFPAKENVALSDGYDPLIASVIAQTPATWPVIQRIGAALVHGFRQVYEAERDTLLAQNKLIVSTPALRERLWANQMAMQQLILQALGSGQHDPRPSFQDRITVAACLAAASTAVLTWVENDGTPELPDLIEQAFDTLTRLGNPLLCAQPLTESRVKESNPRYRQFPQLDGVTAGAVLEPHRIATVLSSRYPIGQTGEDPGVWWLLLSRLRRLARRHQLHHPARTPTGRFPL